MKRIVVVAVALIAFLGVIAPPVSAQAPAPKVTINGLIDTITTGAHNALDSNFASKADSAWWARNRGVFTITGEVGKAKGVLALEIDIGWGQVSANESAASNSGQTLSASSSAIGSPQNAFHQGGWDLGNDLAAVVEVKNLYVEFPMPLIPIPTTVRLGGQPFNTTLKPGVLATTDYGGVWLSSQLAPFAKFNLTYAQAEEQVTGIRASNFAFNRGDDFFLMLSLDLEPMKGILLRPFWGLFQAQGTTAALARCRVSCAGQPGQGAGISANAVTGVIAPIALGNFRTSSTEDRHYIGLDAQMNFGPFFLDPTFIYMTSSVDVYGNAGGQLGGAQAGTGQILISDTLGTQGFAIKNTQNIHSWLLDIRGGWRAGPLLLEGMFMYTPGDGANHNSFRTSRVYHPIANDIGYAAGWTEILSLGSVDYFTSAAHGMGENIGLGRYGRMQIGGRGTYALTPALDLKAKWASAWTDTDVDTDAGGAAPVAGASVSSVGVGSYGNVPCALSQANCIQGNNLRGDSDYIGTEFSLGFTYRFAPGLTFDMSAGYLWSGSALDSTFRNEVGILTKQDAKDANAISARVRYQF